MACIHWFRKGLRLHDNPALVDACRASARVYPVFIIDPWFANPDNVGVNRYRFLLECLHDLDIQLRELKSRLFVVRGTPASVFPMLFRDWGIARLKRDAEVLRLAHEHGVEVATFASHTLYDPDRLLAANLGSCPSTYGSFCKLVAKVGPPPDEAPDLTAEVLPSTDGCLVPPSEHLVPTLGEMGYATAATPSPFPGGEREALRRMQRHLDREAWIASFEKPKTSPNTLDPSTTVLSPYLKFGALSPRRFLRGLQAVERKHRSHTQPPVSLVGQLYWREFFYLNGHAVPNFDRMQGNPICRQVPWRRDGDEETERLLCAWEEARTGYPFIDAVMTQLRAEGWIHHLARHAVACFLTRGDLWVSWERGAKVFDRLLLDADWSINQGNWLWLSASAFFHQYFRVYSPVSFGRKTDPKGAYIRKWVPVLRNFPAKFIYEPWKAPLLAQQAAGCMVGKDYPLPIVDHDQACKANMAKMKVVYSAGKAGGAAAGGGGVDSMSANRAPSKRRAPGAAGKTEAEGGGGSGALASAAPSSGGGGSGVTRGGERKRKRGGAE